MKNLFSAEDNDAIVQRLLKLNPDSVRLWGKMNIAQMLAHCHVPIKSAFAEIATGRSKTGLLFGEKVKDQFINENLFQKNAPTEKDYRIKDERNFLEEREALIKSVRRFASEGENAIKNKIHSFFGELTSQEWAILMWKHLNHHLTQFGV